MAGLTDWIGESSELNSPKPIQMAKALRQRKRAMDNKPALSGSGNIFQRRKQGIEEIVDQASK